MAYSLVASFLHSVLSGWKSVHVPHVSAPRTRYEWETDELAHFLDEVWSTRGEVYSHVQEAIRSYAGQSDSAATTAQRLLSLTYPDSDIVNGFIQCISQGDKIEVQEVAPDLKLLFVRQLSGDSEILAAFGTPNVGEGDHSSDPYIAKLLHLALTGTTYRGAVLSMPDRDASRVLDIMQEEIDSFHRGHSSLIKNIGDWQTVSQLISDFSTTRDLRPSSFMITDVELCYQRTREYGTFSEILMARYQDRTVVLRDFRHGIITSKEKHAEAMKAHYDRLITLRQLRHHRIVAIEGINITAIPDSMSFMMQWMENGDVLQYMKKLEDRNLTLRRLNTWISQVIDALQYLHSISVAHGNLHATNVLIDDNGDACLSDYGLAFLPNYVTMSYSNRRVFAHGSTAPELIDPEMFNDTFHVPYPVSDIYSFGCLCVEIYSGQHLYADQNPRWIENSVVGGKHPGRPSTRLGEIMPNELWNLVQRCWNTDRTQRPDITTVAEEFQEMFERISSPVS